MRHLLTQEQHLLLAHSHQGITQTFEYITRNYYFLGLRKQVETVVRECNICSKSKISRHAPYRLLKSLLTLKQAQSLIALDFIVKLLHLKELMTGFVSDSIIVVIDRLTKYRHFVLYKEASNAKDLIYTFLKVIIAAYRLLDKIISDRDKLFISKFQQSLIAQLRANHKLSTAFHP